ncbi:hypothetical protein PV327_001618 [Microctonus hyperodae]|uniref:HAT C-terminal dimerisation domain-containing protein n=1 Tax=Microctonus hyperodae TaxID=165561 RepID=A0AA39KNB3_MICHY|nr:hypothetical protein PV327_001618 [Microctonus hyperodae]
MSPEGSKSIRYGTNRERRHHRGINGRKTIFQRAGKKADIRYAAFITENNILFRIAADILNFFKDMSKDSEILRSMSIGRTKYPTCDITNQKWMTFFIRYVDPNSLDVKSQLVKLIKMDAKNRSDCEEYLNAIKNDVHESIVTDVRNKCLEFYITAAKEICTRLQIKDPFLNKLKNEEKQILSKMNFDNMWEQICKHSYPNLRKLVSAVRSLPNSNADAEKVFVTITMNAICVVKSAMSMRNETVLKMIIDEDHLNNMTSDILHAVEPREKSHLRLHAGEIDEMACPLGDI